MPWVYKSIACPPTHHHQDVLYGLLLTHSPCYLLLRTTSIQAIMGIIIFITSIKGHHGHHGLLHSYTHLLYYTTRPFFNTHTFIIHQHSIHHQHHQHTATITHTWHHQASVSHHQAHSFFLIKQNWLPQIQQHFIHSIHHIISPTHIGQAAASIILPINLAL